MRHEHEKNPAQNRSNALLCVGNELIDQSMCSHDKVYHMMRWKIICVLCGYYLNIFGRCISNKYAENVAIGCLAKSTGKYQANENKLNFDEKNKRNTQIE